MPEILRMVQSEQAKAAIVDSYILSLHENFFGSTALYVQQLLKSPTYNYGIGLMGNITKLSKIFVEFQEANQAEFTDLLNKYISVKKKVFGSHLVFTFFLA